MDIAMPASFPESDFRAFGIAATNRFLPLISDANLFDPQEKRRHFEWSWQAVRYRYRSCVECSDEFKGLLANETGERWLAGFGNEELVYNLERCIYMFFMGGLSVFDSFAFCLYFYGNAVQPGTFPNVANPRAITRSATVKAFVAAFPQAHLTTLLAALPGDARFSAIDTVRNLVGHRLSGRRSVRGGTTYEEGTLTQWREETWHLPGAAGALVFDEGLLHRQLDKITGLLTPLVSAARGFAEEHSAPTTGVQS